MPKTIVKKVNTRAEKRKPKSRISAKSKAKSGGGNTVTSNRLKLLITVVGRNKAEYYVDLLQSFEINMQMLAMAKGTANRKMLGLLGLSDTDKTVIFSIVQENKVPDALHTLEEKFATIKDGKGVAFTVPLTGVIGTLIYGFLSNDARLLEKK